MLDEPLGLTVHSLPRPQDALAGDGRRTRMGRLKMLVVLAGLRGAGGGLVLHLLRGPPGGPAQLRRTDRAAAAVARADRDRRCDGKPVPLPSLKGQWLLVSVAGGACDAACEQHLYLQRQLRESLGQDKDRVD